MHHRRPDEKPHDHAPLVYVPKAGPFVVQSDEDTMQAAAVDGQVVVKNTQCGHELLTSTLTPAQAREHAANLIECADHIERAAMTREEQNKEALER